MSKEKSKNSHKQDSKKNSEITDINELTIPGMSLENKYKTSPIIPADQEKIQKEMEKTRKDLEKIKDFILKKYNYTEALSVLPPQAMKLFVEEEEIPKETESYIQLYMIIPETHFKDIPKIKPEIVKHIDEMAKSAGQKVWLQIKTPVDVWETCLDSKFELNSAVAMSYPLYDKGILGALRAAEIHKSLVLQKFEKYVVSYVIAGSLVRGDATKSSDVDTYVIINDTDVKRMPRLELRERLRNIIYQYIMEAEQLAGVRNKLNVQIYLLTDFWESVKDAHPVMFTLIRDGVPLYDRGTFLPWKTLLKMGKLRPSPEAIDMYMSMGDKTVERAKKYMMDILIQDIFQGMSLPSQALLMLYGLPATTVQETAPEMKRVFVDKEKLLEKKYVDMLEEVMIKYYKGFEHGKVKEITGKELDRLLKNVEDYTKRLKELRQQIEKRTQENTIEQLYQDTFELLKTIVGKKSQEEIIKEFEIKFIKQGKFPPQDLRILNDIVEARKEFKKGKLDSHKVNEARKNANVLLSDLIEFTQRCELVNIDKSRIRLKYKEKDGSEKVAELLIGEDKSFLFQNNLIKKIVNEKVSAGTVEEVTETVEKQKKKANVEISPKLFEVVKKELGDFEIVL